MPKGWVSMALGALSGLLTMMIACDPADPSYFDEEQEYVDAGALRDEEVLGRTKGDGGINGENDYCNDGLYPCIIGEGDCDDDDQCAGPLVCGSNNGLNFGFSSSSDVCWPPHCENGTLDGDETGIDYGGSCSVVDYCPPPDGTNGDESGYCTAQCPCPAGFGDCDSDAQCDTGFVCGLNNGSKWGMPRLHDVCVIATCNNGVKDSGLGETGKDYGGECGTYDQCLLDRYFLDGDADTYGGSDGEVTDCAGVVIPGSVDNNRDCDDADPGVNPDGVEICNAQDDDCDGLKDEDTVIGALDFWLDDDSDGFGDPAVPGIGCATPPGYVADDTDCDDTRDTVFPGATEVCGNGLDDDCDGINPTCTPGGDFDSSDAWGKFTGATDESLGQSLAAGDVNGDGQRDLVLGGPVIPWRSTPAVAGSVYLLYGPLPGGTVDLTTGADARFTGEVNQDHAGQGLAVGDINNDGMDEIFIGAPNNGDVTYGGRVYMFAGGTHSGSTALASAPAIWQGAAANRYFGYSIGAGRNFVGSSTYGDVAMGAPGNFESGLAGNNGNTYVLKGASTLPSGLVTSIASASGVVKMNGSTVESGFGASVLPVGNVGGSSTPDLAIGAPGSHWWPATPPAYDGDVHVFFGPLASAPTAATADVTVSGADTDDWVGVAIGGSGDLDGDGVNELVVGASGDSSVAANAGRVAIFRGPLTSGSWSVADADIEVLGDTEYTYVGESASIGDFDGDGSGDLSVGSYSQAGYLWYGPIADGSYSLIDADVEVVSVTAGAVNFGWPATFIGDLDGDGAEELAIGDVGEASSKGAVYLFSSTSL